MAFETLATKLSPQIRGISRKIHLRVAFLDADDLYQEMFSFLWEKYCSGALQDKTDSYILQGCYFHIKNFLRKHCKRFEYSSIHLSDFIADTDSLSFENIVSADNSSTDMQNMEVKSVTEQVYRRLNEREQSIFSLSLRGLTKRQIGRNLCISHVMVLKIEKRIRDKCKDIFGEIINN